MAKSADAFRTISEVADWLGVQTHVLRFWESKFSQIKPLKRGGGRRYYRPNDMLLIGGIKTLLYQEGMTIKGAQKYIRENGVKHVASLSQSLEADVINDAGTNADKVEVEVPRNSAAEPHIQTDATQQPQPGETAAPRPQHQEKVQEAAVQQSEPEHPKPKRPAQVKMDSIQLNLFADDEEDDDFDPIENAPPAKVRSTLAPPDANYESLMQYLAKVERLSSAQQVCIAPVMAELEKFIDCPQ